MDLKETGQDRKASTTAAAPSSAIADAPLMSEVTADDVVQMVFQLDDLERRFDLLKASDKKYAPLTDLEEYRALTPETEQALVESWNTFRTQSHRKISELREWLLSNTEEVAREVRFLGSRYNPWAPKNVFSTIFENPAQRKFRLLKDVSDLVFKLDQRPLYVDGRRGPPIPARLLTQEVNSSRDSVPKVTHLSPGRVKQFQATTPGYIVELKHNLFTLKSGMMQLNTNTSRKHISDIQEVTNWLSDPGRSAQLFQDLADPDIADVMIASPAVQSMLRKLESLSNAYSRMFPDSPPLLG